MKILMILGALLFSAVAIQPICAAEYSKTHVINEDSDCRNPNGNEVNRYFHVEAPTEKSFFEKDSVQAYAESDFRSFTDAAGPSGCSVRNAKPEPMTIVTKSGHTITISVLRKFDVYGHSDCGSGTLNKHRFNGDRIRTDCSVKAQVYTEDDLK